MRIAGIVAVAAAIVLSAPASRAAPPSSDGTTLEQQMGEAGALLRQGLDKMTASIAEALRSLPRYELPQMDANGDIIIRRKRPDDDRYGDHNLVPPRRTGEI